MVKELLKLRHRKPLNKYIFFGLILLSIGVFCVVLGFLFGYDIGLQKGIELQDKFIRENYFLIMLV